ncbi:MAG TPA: hypothetical protein VK079_00230 [Bacillota bacterium]|nr:hypothetical protein [Bacillota bacterium]
MSIQLIIFLSVLFIVTVALTVYAFMQQEKQIKEYEEQGDTVADELERSLEYEKKSIGYHMPVQVVFYLVSLVLIMVGTVVFIYFLNN